MRSCRPIVGRWPPAVVVAPALPIGASVGSVPSSTTFRATNGRRCRRHGMVARIAERAIVRCNGIASCRSHAAAGTPWTTLFPPAVPATPANAIPRSPDGSVARVWTRALSSCVISRFVPNLLTSRSGPDVAGFRSLSRRCRGDLHHTDRRVRDPCLSRRPRGLSPARSGDTGSTDCSAGRRMFGSHGKTEAGVARANRPEQSTEENRERRIARDLPARKHCSRRSGQRCGRRADTVAGGTRVVLLGGGVACRRRGHVGLDPGRSRGPCRRGSHRAPSPAPQLHPDHHRTGRSASTRRSRTRSTTSGPIPIASRYRSNDPNSRLIVSQPACRKLGCTPST